MTLLLGYFGGLGADKRTIYELLLEQRGARYTVMAVTGSRHLSAGAAAPAAPRRWLSSVSGSPATRRLYDGQNGRVALRTLFWAARAANLADHGQRFCYVLPSVPAQPGALAALLPGQLRYDGSLPIHPQLWQVGRPLDTLPVERHRHACTDPRCAVQLTTGGQSLDEECLR